MTKKYIELEEAIMAIEKPKVTPGGVIFDALKKACQEEVRNLPAADVVEVVRCKDCIHRASRIGVHYDIEFPDAECPCQRPESWNCWMPNDDWYCANGERKDGGQDE